jgi:alpha-D-xyloside xylohydrolase
MSEIALPKRKAARLFFILLLTGGGHLTSFSGPPVRFLKLADGIMIYPDSGRSGNTKAVRLQVISADIIRITASPVRDLPESKSLMTSYAALPLPKWSLEEGEKQFTLKTDSVFAAISTETGSVSFTDFRGNPLISEKAQEGRLFEPAVFDGELFYHIRQSFNTQPGEAFYGLGQHQDGILDHNHRQVNLFQNNSEVAVPFLVSNRHYGILLDN